MSNARNKLNAAAIHGILIVAGVVSFIARSWPVFWLVTAVLLGTAILAGDIRPGNRQRKR